MKNNIGAIYYFILFTSVVQGSKAHYKFQKNATCKNTGDYINNNNKPMCYFSKTFPFTSVTTLKGGNSILDLLTGLAFLEQLTSASLVVT